LDLIDAAMAAVHIGGVGEAHRAGEVARFVDLDDREAAVLLMVGAQAAVERAAGLGPGLRRQRPVARLDPQFLLPPIIEVVADQRLLDAVVAAPLEVEDLVILDDHLGRDQLEAGLAQARRLAVEQIMRRLALLRVRRPLHARLRCRVPTRVIHKRSAPASGGETRSADRAPPDTASGTPTGNAG